MLTNSLSHPLSYASPPPRLRAPALETSVLPTDSLADAREKESDSALRKTLQAMASLALLAAPHTAKASQEVAGIESVAGRDDEIAPAAQFGQNFRDAKSSLKDSLDPHGYLGEHKGKVGDYDLSVSPVDLNLRGRLKGGKPGLLLKGDFLETSLSRKESIDDNWTRHQGFRAKLHGEVGTFGDSKLNLQAGVFREYRGTIADDYQVRLQADAGLEQRFLGEDQGLRAGISLRQEIEGGNHSLFGHDVKLYAEGRQGAYYNFGRGRTEMNYSFMAGPKKDFDLNVLGHQGKLTVTIGPEIKGDSYSDSFDLGVKSKVRVRF